MPDQLVFNDSLNLAGIAGTGLTNLGGTTTIDYTTNTVTGSLSVSLGALGVQTYTNLAITQTGTSGGQPVYTLTGSNTLTNVSITYTGQLPTTMSANLNVLIGGATVASGTGNVTSTVVCFVEGTLIRTPDGDVPIETLSVGDLIVTSSGAELPIKWLGHRTIDCRDHSNPEAVQPIWISAHAFGPSLPADDLFLSPGHAIAVSVLEEVLIPASSLVNEATIATTRVDEVTYWHLELAEHEVVFANGMPAETYIDIGNRKFFDGYGISGDHLNVTYSIADYCRPFVTSGVILDAVRNRLRVRAMRLGWRVDEHPEMDLHIVADGRKVDADWEGDCARFIIPADTKSLSLLSASSVPAHISDSRDGRRLGILIDSMSIDDGLAERRKVDLKWDELGDGFYGEEQTGDGDFIRWTNGHAELSPALWQNCKGAFFLRLGVGPLVARWVSPEAASRTDPVESDNVSPLRRDQRKAAA